MVVGRTYQVAVGLTRLGAIPKRPAGEGQQVVRGPVRVGDSATVCVWGGESFDIRSSLSGERCATQYVEAGPIVTWHFDVTPRDTMLRYLRVSLLTFRRTGGRVQTFDSTYAVHVRVVDTTRGVVGRVRMRTRGAAEWLAILAGIVTSLTVIGGGVFTLWRRFGRSGRQAQGTPNKAA